MEVFPEDQGQYICVARNPAGQATTSAYLTVQETKEITVELEMEQPQVEEDTSNFPSSSNIASDMHD